MPIDLESGSAKEALNELCRYRDAGNLNLLVGAGLSVPAGAPTWMGLLRKLAEKLPEDIRTTAESRIERRDFLGAAQLIKSELGDKFYSVLDRIFSRDLDRNAAEATFQLLARIPFRVRLTTNYDQLIYLHDVPIHPKRPLDTVTWEEASHLPRFIEDPDKRLLIHLHGVVNRPQTIVLTREDYREMFRRPDYRKTLELLFSRPMLILGFGLEDIDLMSTIEDLAQLFDSEVPRFAMVSMNGDWGHLSSRFHVTPVLYEPSSGHPEVLQFLQRLLPPQSPPVWTVEPNPSKPLEGTSLPSGMPAKHTPFMAPLPTQPFAGRDLELDLYASLLTRRDGPIVVPIAGLPGVGKTTMAIQLAQRLASVFADGVLWYSFVDGNPTEAVAAFERELGLSPMPGSPETLAARFRRQAANLRLLIVLDNIESLEIVRPLLLNDGTSRIVLTTRDVSIASRLEVAPLAPVDANQAMMILRAHAGKVFIEKDAKEARDFVSFGGGLPLVLEVLGKAANDVGSLKLVLKDAHTVSGGSIETLFEKIWEPLDPQTRMTLCAMGLAPDGSMSLDALAHSIDSSIIDAGRAAAILRRVGLIGESKDRLQTHPTVLKFATDKLNSRPDCNAMKSRWLAYYITFAQQLGAKWDSGERANATRDLKNELINFDVLANSSEESIKSVTQILGKILYNVKDLSRAETWLRKAIAIDERLDDQSNLAICYNNLSQIFDARGDLIEAESWLRKAIAIDERLDDQPRLAIRYNNLSQIFDARGDLIEAELWLRKAIAIGERLDDQPRLAIRYNNLSQIFKARGDLIEAETWLRKAIAIDDLLDDQPKLAIGYNNLSLIFKARGDLIEAESWLRKAIVIDRRLDDQPKLAIDYNNLSLIFNARGDLIEAEFWLRQAIAIDERLDDQPNLAIRYNNLSQIFKARGDLIEAELWLRQAIAIDERLDNRPNLAIEYNNLSLNFEARGDLIEAESWLRKAIDIAERLNDKVKLRVLYDNGKQIAIEAGRSDEAQDFSKKLRSLDISDC